MPQENTFTVSKKGVEEEVEINFPLPESVEDDRWNELTVGGLDDVNTLACQSLVIKVQAACRRIWDQGPEAMQALANSYQFGARSGGFSRPKITKKAAKEAKFSAEQISALKAAGVDVSDLE